MFDRRKLLKSLGLLTSASLLPLDDLMAFPAKKNNALFLEYLWKRRSFN